MDPLNLESQNQAENIPGVSRVPQSKIGGKSVRGFLSYDRTNRDFNLIYREIPVPGPRPSVDNSLSSFKFFSSNFQDFKTFLRQNLKNLSRGANMVFNFSRFKPALN